MLSLVAGDLRRGLRPQRDSNWCGSRGQASARPLQHPKRQCLPLRTQQDGQLSLQGGATKYLNNYVVWCGTASFMRPARLSAETWRTCYLRSH